MGTVVFLGVKQLGRGTDHPPPSNAEVKERVELYVYSPSGPSWPVLGWTLLYFKTVKFIHDMSYSAKRSSVLNAHNPEDNNGDSKDSFYQDLEQVFCHFPLAPYAKSDRFQRCHIKGRKHTECSRIGSPLFRHLSQFCLHLMLVRLQVLFHENYYFICFHFNSSMKKTSIL